MFLSAMVMHYKVTYFMDALYDVTYFWLFVEFFVLPIMRPGVRAFYFLVL